MMTVHDLYQVILSIIPLYIAMFVGYGSVKWWKVFNQEQCSGISRFCLLLAVPVLSFHYIIKTNLYELNLKLFGADVLQKVVVIIVTTCWYKLGPGGSMERLITIFSICTLPNALILGVPILKSMFRATATPLVVEIFLAQSVIWHTLLLIMYEYRATKIVISQQFGDTHGRDANVENTAIGERAVVEEISSTDIRVEEDEADGVANIGGGKGEDLDIHIHLEGHKSSCDKPSVENERGEIQEVPSTSTIEAISETTYQRMSSRPASMPSTSAMTKQIMIMVWKKLIGNPNTYATILGLACAFVLSRFQIVLPLIVSGPIRFLSNASLGMGMFNMGLSMGLQPTVIPCSLVVAALTMVLRFIIGPIVMAFASLAVGMRGTIFRIAVVQAAISQGVAPSVFAVQYNVYPEVFSVGAIVGMVVVLPVTLLYYNLLEN